MAQDFEFNDNNSEDGDDNQQPDLRRVIHFFLTSLTQPFYEGSDQTLQQYVFQQVEWKRCNNMPDTAFHQHLCVKQTCKIPRDNFAPVSLYLILCVKELWELRIQPLLCCLLNLVRYWHNVQQMQHGILPGCFRMLCASSENDKDVVSLIYVEQPKPPVFAQFRSSSSCSGSGSGSGCQHMCSRPVWVGGEQQGPGHVRQASWVKRRAAGAWACAPGQLG